MYGYEDKTYNEVLTQAVNNIEEINYQMQNIFCFIDNSVFCGSFLKTLLDLHILMLLKKDLIEHSQVCSLRSFLMEYCFFHPSLLDITYSIHHMLNGIL